MRTRRRDVFTLPGTTRLLAGGLAGAAATIPMTALLVLWRRALPWRQREALPPVQITNALLARADLDDDLSSPQQARLALANHFAYGAAMGSFYGLIAGSPHSRPIASGCGVWIGSLGRNLFGPFAVAWFVPLRAR
jgi:hypothetical protein